MKSQKSSVNILSETTKNNDNAAAVTHLIRTSKDHIFCDLWVRFILNLPSSELQNPYRVWVSLEQAWWFYYDHVLQNPTPLSSDQAVETRLFLQFNNRMMQTCPFFPNPNLYRGFKEYKHYLKHYKYKIPVVGIILVFVSAGCPHVLMVQTIHAHQHWGFPKGKKNKTETPLDTGLRELEEETGIKIISKSKAKTNEPFWLEYDEKHTYAILRGREKCPIPPIVPGSLQSKEIENIQWISIDEASSLNGHPKFALTKIVQKLWPRLLKVLKDPRRLQELPELELASKFAMKPQLCSLMPKSKELKPLPTNKDDPNPK
jgi:8-oxo-dGTP pyrophosphatase MutT (NUDIX family)